MPNKDKRVDAYIAKSQDFAKPILNHIRELVYTACPDTEETMKWSFPHFDYYGSTFALWHHSNSTALSVSGKLS